MNAIPPSLTVLLPHGDLGGGEAAMIEVARELASRFELSIAVTDLAPVDTDSALTELLERHFQRVVRLAHRWQLRPLLAATDAVVWYGTTGSVPRALEHFENRPASIRLIHTARRLDGVGYHRRWGHTIDRTVCVVPEVARSIPGAAFLPNLCDPDRLAGERRSFWSGAAGRRPVIGFLGRLVPLKNVDWLIDELEAAGANLLIQAFDSGGRRAELERRASRRGVADRVRFLPPGPEVGTLLASVDAVALPSSREGLPLVVLEAGLVGTPVIATPVGALPELFPEEIVYLEPGPSGRPATGSLGEAIARLEPGAAQPLTAAVRALLDRDRVIARWVEVVDEALASRCAGDAYSSSASSP